MTATTAPGPRIATLDIVRGVAVMGILAMNILGFALPSQAYFNPRAYGGADGADLWAWILSFIFVDGKMRGLFSFLFGASMLLVIERAAAKNENPAAVHYRRMAWLLLFGLAHLYFIWWGDILSHYALIGLVAYFFRNQKVATLIKWAAGLLVVQTAVMAMMAFGFLTVSAAAAAPDASPDVVAQWQALKADFAPPPPDVLEEDLATHRGPWVGQVVHRLEDWHGPVTFLPFFGWETLAYMLLGMAGLKSGFLTGAWDRARYRRWALVGYAISVPVYALFAWLVVRSGFDTALTVALGFAAPTPVRPVMIIAHAALIVLAFGGGGWLADRIGAAGRAAFTNYLGTSILMTFIFYGWGLGLYGQLGRAEIYLLVPLAWALMLLWSKPWLDRNRYGPFEWLWRSLARGRLQPMRKAPSAA
ncbi:MAG: DUF418 domain-containing protein [Allosphingosinicella sp.]|uniref:DUF418 domain-containing protein n=1 Tax=Allosphingosinicella sp. TaxID=2823234 RepID=UPI00394955C0